MNDDFDSMNDLDSILAEFGGSAPQEPGSDRSRASGEEADADARSRERRARPGEAE